MNGNSNPRSLLSTAALSVRVPSSYDIPARYLLILLRPVAYSQAYPLLVSKFWIVGLGSCYKNAVMLRFEPSRIRLTLADLEGFEERFQARQSTRLARPPTSNLRLSPGPAHPTRLSVVSVDQNFGRQRAASSSSDIEVWDDNDKPEHAGPSALDGNDGSLLTTPTDVRHQPVDESILRQDAVRALDGVARPRCSPTRSSPRRHVDSFHEERRERREILEIEREIAEHSPASNLDGVDESELGSLPPVTPFAARENHGRLPPQTEPRALSSARARRRHARSSEEPGIHHEGIRPFSTQSQMWLNPVPQLVLPVVPTRPSQPSLDPSLNPGAPVFVPRTRFGTAGSSTDGGASTVYERPWRSLDHTSSSSNLRVLSSGELNIEHLASYHRNGPARQSTNEQLHPRQRQRSRTSDQNTAFPLPSPNLERYPLLRPSASLAAPRTSSTVGSPANIVDRPPTSAAFITTDEEPPTSESHRPQQYHVRHVFAPQNSEHLLAAPSGLTLGLRSISPALSTSSRSTPNLLNPPLHPAETHSRGSSLSWRRSRRPTPVGHVHRAPSMPISTSSSPHPIASRASSREGLDAAAEFLRMRNSPLDDLTERLSRLAAGRQRSVGRSWERPVGERRGRVSLLTGDPFRQESEPDPATSVPSPATMDDFGNPAKLVDRSARRLLETEADPVAVAMALPPSSPLPSSSQALPSTPPARPAPALSSPRSPLAQRSPKKSMSSPPPSVKRKPVPSSSSIYATPRVKIYDDAKPATAQPQTPADITRSSRRAKTRSDTAPQQSPFPIGRTIVMSPERAPLVPDRNPYRNTYPPAPTVDALDGTHSHSGAGAVRARRRAQAQRSSENEAENDVESGIAWSLEQDRRTWLTRQEQGDLDVTPPREGRFERYLS